MGISREPTGINSLFLSRLAAVAVLAVGGGGDCGSISHNLLNRGFLTRL